MSALLAGPWGLALDTALLVLVSLRLIRLVISDYLATVSSKPLFRAVSQADPESRRGRVLHFLAIGATCPWCLGFWVCVLVVGSYAAAYYAGGEGSTLHTAWRWLAAPFAINWLAVTIGSRTGDYDLEDDDDL